VHSHPFALEQSVYQFLSAALSALELRAIAYIYVYVLTAMLSVHPLWGEAVQANRQHRTLRE